MISRMSSVVFGGFMFAAFSAKKCYNKSICNKVLNVFFQLKLLIYVYGIFTITSKVQYIVLVVLFMYKVFSLLYIKHTTSFGGFLGCCCSFACSVFEI